MISSIEERINRALEHEKKPTELVVRQEEITWEYAIVSYQAEWTYGIEFDLFDKVIVGILLVEDRMSLEEIGTILGMNVVHDPDNFKIKDNAEYDILRIAIDNLLRYDMVQVSDIHYSDCRLTPLGKQYAEHGKKFQTESQKTFELVFDRTRGASEIDREKYKELNGKPSPLRDTAYFEQFDVIQQAARYQEPNLVDVEKGNSINNPIVLPLQSKLIACTFLKITLYDLETFHPRYIVVNPDNLNIIEFATEWCNAEEELDKASEISSLEESNGLKRKLSDDLFKLQTNLSNISSEIQKQISENDEFNQQDIIHRMLAQDILEVGLFSRHLGHLIDEETQEIIIQCSNISEKDFGLWKRIFGKLKNVPTFILFSKASSSENTQEQLKKFKNQLNSSRGLIYCGSTSSKTENSISLVSKEKCLKFTLSEVILPSAFGSFKKQVLKRSESPLNQYQELFHVVKTAISEKLFPGLLRSTIQDIQKAKEDQRVNKKKIDLYTLICSKGIPLSTYITDETSKREWKNTLDAKDELVNSKKSELRTALKQQFNQLKKEQEPRELADVDQRIEKAKYLLLKVHPDLTDIENQLTRYVQSLIRRKQLLLAREKARTFILDTNVFINDPDILERINSPDQVALSLRVIEELDQLKTKKSLQEQARLAIKNIHAELNSSKGKESRVKKVRTTLKVLPEELREEKADNYILSTAVLLKKNNPILVTYDKNLETKAMMLEIPTYGEEEIIKAFGKPPAPSFRQKQVEVTEHDIKNSCKSILMSMIKKENGSVHVSRFLGAIKSEIPNFDYKKNGYKSASQFLRSIPNVKIIDNKVSLK